MFINNNNNNIQLNTKGNIIIYVHEMHGVYSIYAAKKEWCSFSVFLYMSYRSKGLNKVLAQISYLYHSKNQIVVLANNLVTVVA